MKGIRIDRKAFRHRRDCDLILPLDPRDPDVVRGKKAREGRGYGHLDRLGAVKAKEETRRARK